MKITICGAGNAAQTLIALLTGAGQADIAVYAPLADEVQRLQLALPDDGLTAAFPDGVRHQGRPALVTADAGAAGADAHLVLLALPAFAHEAVLRALAPHLPPTAWVGALPARGGFDLLTQHVLGDDRRVTFGLQTLPWACRIREWGVAVDVLGVKAMVEVAAAPAGRTAEVAAALGALFRVPLAPIANFLALTLANTGQIIHPGIMYGLFHNWDGQTYAPDQIPQFYGGVDAATAEFLELMSGEVLAVRDAIQTAAPAVDLTGVVDVGAWLLAAYPDQIRDKRSLQAAFNSNTAYAGLAAPMVKSGERFVPAFHSRYLAEDVPYSLLVTRGIAELAGVPTPHIDRVIVWAQERLGREYLVAGRVTGADITASHAPQRFGIDTLAALVKQ